MQMHLADWLHSGPCATNQGKTQPRDAVSPHTSSQQATAHSLAATGRRSESADGRPRQRWPQSWRMRSKESCSSACRAACTGTSTTSRPSSTKRPCSRLWSRKLSRRAGKWSTWRLAPMRKMLPPRYSPGCLVPSDMRLISPSEQAAISRLFQCWRDASGTSELAIFCLYHAGRMAMAAFQRQRHHSHCCTETGCSACLPQWPTTSCIGLLPHTHACLPAKLGWGSRSGKWLWLLRHARVTCQVAPNQQSSLGCAGGGRAH